MVTLLAQKFVAPLLDRYLGRTGYDSQQTEERVGAGRPHNLWHPLDQEPGSDHGAHGGFDDKSHTLSPQLWASQHPVVSGTGALSAAGLGAWIAARRLAR